MKNLSKLFTFYLTYIRILIFESLIFFIFKVEMYCNIFLYFGQQSKFELGRGQIFRVLRLLPVCVYKRGRHICYFAGQGKLQGCGKQLPGKWKGKGGKSRSQAGSLTCESLFSCLSNYISLPPILHPPIPHHPPTKPISLSTVQTANFLHVSTFRVMGKGDRKGGGDRYSTPRHSGVIL